MEPTRVSHFEILRLIGRGGMGEVHEATDLKLRRRVALKFLSPELTNDPAALARFEREALSAAELNHPHIATVYTFEKDGDRPFIAMELLAGSNLRDRIDAGPIPISDALAIARDIAAALAYAHRRGTSHRDIKPENLMFDEHGEIKIMDFGLARATMASKLTVTGTSLGTPAYMAPEAIRGQTGPEGNVFALGLVVYEMLAGRRAYPGDNAMAVMFAIANEDPPPLSGLRPDVPEAVDVLVRALLVKDPAERMSAATAAQELGAMTGVTMSAIGLEPAGESRSAVLRGAAATTSANSMPGDPSAAVGTAAPPIRSDSDASKRPRAIAVIAWLVVVIGGAFFVFFQDRGTSRRSAEAERIQRQAVQLGQAGKLDQARDLYLAALELDSKQAGALTMLGILYRDQGLYTTAESLFNAVIRHNPKDAGLRASGYYNLGSTQLATGAFSSAVANLRTAFALDSSNAEAYNNLGWALIKNGQASDALVVLKRGIAAFPSEKFLYKNAGLAALQMDIAPEAVTFLDRALQLDSTFTEARELRAQAAGRAR